MNSLQLFFFYLFWPNPGNASYASGKVLAALIVCALLVLLSIAISVWRKGLKDAMLKKVSRSWATASFWFGLTGLMFVVSRVEQIQFMAMRFWWVLWFVFALFYVYIQYKYHRATYYQVLPTILHEDPRSKYLPKRKR